MLPARWMIVPVGVLAFSLSSALASPPRHALDETPGGEEPDPSSMELPWPLNVEQRFVWLESGQKVGETTFKIERVPNSSRFSYLLSAARRYDKEGISQRSASTTVFEPGGLPLKFKETLNLSNLNAVVTRQEIELEVKGRRAHVTWVHNGDTRRAVRREIELPEQTFLFANQAVEHWAIFASTFPPVAQEHEVSLLYPDFNKVLAVSFRLKAQEELTIGKNKIETRRYTFQARDSDLSGVLWLDKKGRMVQIEYPKSSLRVVRSFEQPTK